MSAPRGSLGPNLLLLALSLLVATLVAEVGLRLLAHGRNRGLLNVALSAPVEVPANGRATLGHMIRLSANPRIIYELKPNLDVTFIGAPATTNAAGFRGPLYPEAKPPGTRRIVGLGDSFMFGHGVADGEVYLQVLEGLLNRRSAGPRFETVNTAVPGYNTAMEVEVLKSRGLAYGPDLVLIHFVRNDFDLPNFIRVEEPVLALDRSFLVELVRGFFASPSVRRGLRGQGLTRAPKAEGSREFANDPDQVPPEYRSMVGWESYAAAMRELAELSASHHFRVLLVTFAPNVLTRRHQRVFELGQSLGFATLDVGETYRAYLEAHDLDDYRSSPLAVSPDNMHPSALGHQVAARVLFSFLCEHQFAGEIGPCALAPW